MSLPSVRSLFRQFVQRPALMVAATATLGVSIGAATAISSAVKAVLLGPLPMDQPERLGGVVREVVARHDTSVNL